MSMLDYRSLGIFVFLDAIRIVRPSFFVIENVKGIISAAQKHRPLSKRGPGYRYLHPKEEHGSAFFKILKDLEKLAKEQKYCISWGIMNAADYGCPQSRERLIIIGSKDGHFIWPKATHSKMTLDDKSKWMTLKDALSGLIDENPKYENFAEKTKNFMKLVPAGKNWRALPENMRKEAIGAAFESWGGRSGFLRRLAWDKPAPTITSSPTARATMLCHPTENRPLTIRECARIQQFPDGWEFSGFVPQQYKQIGNATPLSIGHAVGKEILKASKKKKRGVYKGNLICSDNLLLERMARSPATKLNPPKMRKSSDPLKAHNWLIKSNGQRHCFERFVSINDLSPTNGKVLKEIFK
jgi:DNA (cytosine-5)-methyltransferase 1